jgi:hypothetical protein
MVADWLSAPSAMIMTDAGLPPASRSPNSRGMMKAMAAAPSAR